MVGVGRGGVISASSFRYHAAEDRCWLILGPQSIFFSWPDEWVGMVWAVLC